MLAIELTFPGHRYHATPWDHHVNEGVVEWPPSPWRFLRALVATRYLKATERVSEEQLSDLVAALGAVPPHYALPSACAAHTRHYMPLGQLEKGVEKTSKIFDTFIHIERGGRLQLQWLELELTEPQLETLDALLNCLGYLGRAESWVEAKRLKAPEPPRNRNSWPLGPNDDAESTKFSGHELTRVLCPMPEREYAEWRSRAFEETLARQLADKQTKLREKGKDPQSAKLSKAEKERLSHMLPRTLSEVLQVNTSEMHKEGWNQAPGSQWVTYVRPKALLTNSAPTQTVAPAGDATVARYAVASQVRPRLTEVMSVAERVRLTLMSHSKAAPVFSGKQPNGERLAGHQHAFILPEANSEHGRITHITVFAPMKFDEVARQALDRVQKVWGRGGHELQLVLVGVGKPDDFGGADTRAGQSPALMTSKTWVSRTPFVSTRHAKTNRSGVPKLDEMGVQIGSAEHDLRRLLRESELPTPIEITPVADTTLDGKPARWLEFKTQRSKKQEGVSGGGARSVAVGQGFRIVFAEPVQGPISLGYGAHFGLGMFVAEVGGSKA